MNRIITNLLLLVIIILLLFVMNMVKHNDNNRFNFEVNHQTREIYMFDQKTGTLYLTSPEIVGDYADEIWVELNPDKKENSLSFREFLQDTSRRKLRKQFINQKKQLEDKADQANNQ